jgi:multidrug efflux pump
MALILLAGVVSYLSIPIESDPDVQIPVLIVTVPHEGISPEDAERLLIMPTEVELRDVEGIDEMISFGSEGAATVIAQFDVDADPDRALTDTREAVDRAKAKMPRTIEEPIISEATANDWPVAVVNFAGEGVPERVLYQLALKLKDEFESIPAVLEARLAGDREEVLEARDRPGRAAVLRHHERASSSPASPTTTGSSRPAPSTPATAASP